MCLSKKQLPPNGRRCGQTTTAGPSPEAELLKIASGNDLNAQLQVLKASTLSEAVLTKLLNNPATNDVALQHPSLSPVFQKKIASDYRYDRWFKYLALNPALTEEAFELLMDEELDWTDARFAIAQRPDLTLPQQHRLAKDYENSVRSNLARNPALLPSVQETLADDNSTSQSTYLNDVQCSLAQNSSITHNVQEKLALVMRWDVTEALVRNPSLSSPVALLILSLTSTDISDEQQCIADEYRESIGMKQMPNDWVLKYLGV